MPRPFLLSFVRLLRTALSLGELQIVPDAPGRVRAPKPQFQEAGLPWRSTSRRKVLLRGVWRRQENITMQEVRAVGLLGRHLARSQGDWNQRYLLMVDSSSTIGCYTKGRSSVWGHLIQCRRLLAIYVMTGIKFIFRWVSTKFNFADGPSRGWKRPGVVPEQP